jgi:uncharacterized membrane protein
MEDSERFGRRHSDDPDDGHSLAQVVDRNIQALVERRRQTELNKGTQDRIADAITRFTGSLRFVYIHLVLYSAWIVINLGWTPLPRFDPTFVVLAMAASVEAIFLSTFVLISQNRMQVAADRRADLDLQVSLLAEHEITRVIQLVSEIAERMGIQAARDPESHVSDCPYSQILAPLKDAWLHGFAVGRVTLPEH